MGAVVHGSIHSTSPFRAGKFDFFRGVHSDDSAYAPVFVSRASDHDVKFLLQLVLLAFPIISGAPGRPRELPRLVRADQGYTSKDLLGLCGVRAEIPQRGKDSVAFAGPSSERSPS